MAADWINTTIGELLESEGGEIKTGPFGTKLKASEYANEGVPIISVGEVQLGRIVLHDRTPKVNSAVTDRMPEYLLEEGDIVFGRKGAVERSALVKGKQEGWFLGSDGIRLRLPETVNKQFIAYQFLSELHQRWMIQHAAGTTMASLNEGIVRRIPIKLAPYNEQQSIAHILGSIDDKIELNRQINQTLEQMAQALFKSWFVDFDPVIDNALDTGNPIPEELQAKAAQRKQLREAVAQGEAEAPALPDNIRSLFPSEFEFTEEMGRIPKGWGGSAVSNFGQVVCGKTPSKKNSEFYDGDIPFIKIPDTHGKVYVVETSDSLTHEGHKSQHKKLVPAGSICVSCIATVGQVVIAANDSHTNQQINTIIPSETRDSIYLFFTMRSLKRLLHDLASGGSATLNLNTSTFSKIQLLNPCAEVLKKFAEISQPMFDKILHSEQESIQLSKLRDNLLPKLISGELQIPEAEQQVADALN